VQHSKSGIASLLIRCNVQWPACNGPTLRGKNLDRFDQTVQNAHFAHSQDGCLHNVTKYFHRSQGPTATSHTKNTRTTKLNQIAPKARSTTLLSYDEHYSQSTQHTVKVNVTVTSTANKNDTMTVFLKNLDLSKLKKKRNKSNNNCSSNRSRPRKVPVNRPQITSFPVKLHRMLTEVEREGKEYIVSWNPDGHTFQVHNHDKFVAEILPQHFKQSKYKSFQRQLNFYAFQRITSGQLEGAYGHHHFIRGDEEAARAIKRQTNQQQQQQQQQQQLLTPSTSSQSIQSVRDGLSSTLLSTSHSDAELFSPTSFDFSPLDDNDAYFDVNTIFNCRNCDTNTAPVTSSSTSSSAPLDSSTPEKEQQESAQDEADEEAINKILTQFRRRGSFILSPNTVAAASNAAKDCNAKTTRESFRLIHDQLRRRNSKMMMTTPMKMSDSIETSRLSFVGRSFFVLPVDFTDI
jgi:HSF-type DNA-binding